MLVVLLRFLILLQDPVVIDRRLAHRHLHVPASSLLVRIPLVHTRLVLTDLVFGLALDQDTPPAAVVGSLNGGPRS